MAYVDQSDMPPPRRPTERTDTADFQSVAATVTADTNVRPPVEDDPDEFDYTPMPEIGPDPSDLPKPVQQADDSPFGLFVDYEEKPPTPPKIPEAQQGSPFGTVEDYQEAPPSKEGGPPEYVFKSGEVVIGPDFMAGARPPPKKRIIETTPEPPKPEMLTLPTGVVTEQPKKEPKPFRLDAVLEQLKTEDGRPLNEVLLGRAAELSKLTPTERGIRQLGMEGTETAKILLAKERAERTRSGRYGQALSGSLGIIAGATGTMESFLGAAQTVTGGETKRAHVPDAFELSFGQAAKGRDLPGSVGETSAARAAAMQRMGGKGYMVGAVGGEILFGLVAGAAARGGLIVTARGGKFLTMAGKKVSGSSKVVPRFADVTMTGVKTTTKPVNLARRFTGDVMQVIGRKTEGAVGRISTITQLAPKRTTFYRESITEEVPILGAKAAKFMPEKLGGYAKSLDDVIPEMEKVTRTKLIGIQKRQPITAATSFFAKKTKLPPIDELAVQSRRDVTTAAGRIKPTEYITQRVQLVKQHALPEGVSGPTMPSVLDKELTTGFSRKFTQIKHKVTGIRGVPKRDTREYVSEIGTRGGEWIKGATPRKQIGEYGGFVTTKVTEITPPKHILLSPIKEGVQRATAGTALDRRLPMTFVKETAGKITTTTRDVGDRVITSPRYVKQTITKVTDTGLWGGTKRREIALPVTQSTVKGVGIDEKIITKEYGKVTDFLRRDYTGPKPKPPSTKVTEQLPPKTSSDEFFKGLYGASEQAAESTIKKPDGTLSKVVEKVDDAVPDMFKLKGPSQVTEMASDVATTVKPKGDPYMITKTSVGAGIETGSRVVDDIAPSIIRTGIISGPKTTVTPTPTPAPLITEVTPITSQKIKPTTEPQVNITEILDDPVLKQVNRQDTSVQQIPIMEPVRPVQRPQQTEKDPVPIIEPPIQIQDPVQVPETDPVVIPEPIWTPEVTPDETPHDPIPIPDIPLIPDIRIDEEVVDDPVQEQEPVDTPNGDPDPIPEPPFTPPPENGNGDPPPPPFIPPLIPLLSTKRGSTGKKKKKSLKIRAKQTYNPITDIKLGLGIFGGQPNSAKSTKNGTKSTDFGLDSINFQSINIIGNKSTKKRAIKRTKKKKTKTKKRRR